MNNERLDELLRQIASEKPPELDESFAEDVFLEIARRHKIRKLAGWLAETLELFRRPSLAFGAISLVIVIGVVGEFIVSSRQDFSAALGMDAFSSSAPTLPSTLIARIHE